MNKIIITGGSGFIGSALCKFYLKKNFIVYNFDLVSNKLIPKNKNYFFIKGDIANKKDLERAFKKKVKFAIHLAYINGTEKFYQIPVNILKIAALGIINFCDLCARYKIKKIAIASSSEVYANPLKLPTNETEMLKVPDIFNPRFSYGGGKIFSEIYAQNFFYEKKIKNLIIFRPHNIYSNKMGNYHVLPQLFQKINKQIRKSFIKLKIQGTGREVRSFMYINDFVKAFDLVFFSKHKNGIFNIGNDDPITINALVKKISKLIKKKIYISNEKIKKGSPTTRLPDITKIKKLGYKQSISLNDGLKSFLQK